MPRRHVLPLAAAASAALMATTLGALPGSPSVAAGAPHHPTKATHGKAGHGKATHGKAKATETRGDFDARQGATAAQQASLRAKAMVETAKPAVQSFASSLGGQSVVDIDPLTGTPSQVARLDGLLTGPSAASARAVALDYVRAHQDVFRLSDSDLAGLRLTRDYVDVDGIHHLSFSQRVGGVPVFGNGLKANVTKDGRLINVQGAPVAGLATQAPVGGGLTEQQAVAKARRDAGAASTTPTASDSARKVLFMTAGGLRRAYQVVTMSSTDPTLAVVDATSGWVLYRDHLSDDFAPAADDQPGAGAASSGHQYGLAYPNYPGAPTGGSQVRVDLTAPGWLPTGSRTLVGNNVRTYSDVNDDNKQQSTERVKPLDNGNFTFRLNPFFPAQFGCTKAVVCDWQPNQPGSWEVNRKQTATNNFVLINQYHDYLEKAPIGFTEAAGNFQKVNASGEGKGGDPVIDQPLDGASTAGGLPDGNHIDNANFATPPDGQSPTMQMYLFHQPGTTLAQDPFLPVSGADEADVVLHEYTHGLSHRLVVDASNNPALDSTQGGSMGEAWSDYYAMDYLRNKDLIADQPGVADVLVGRYVSNDQNLIRTEPIDCQVDSPASQCPGTAGVGSGGYTYADFGKIAGGPEVHADGEIWGQTLWQLRTALGAEVTDSIVTRGMELSPTFPSYLDMRNAIVLADQAVYGGAHVDQIWSVFAQRGMGYFAGTVTGDDTAPVADFSTPPPAGAPTGTVTGTVTDSVTGAPVSGVVVAFGGHDSGLPGADWATTTGPDGSYTLTDVVAGTYPDVYAFGAGYDLATKTVTVTAGTTTEDFTLTRDWAAASGGATIADTNGNEYAGFGCGASADIDQSTANGWVTNVPTPPASKYLVVKLPEAVDLTQVAVNPTASCGVAGSASTADYTVETSTDGTTYEPAASGTFTVADRGHLVPVALAAGSGDAVQYIRFTMLTNQLSQVGGSCPGPFDGCTYLSSTELEAFGSPAS